MTSLLTNIPIEYIKKSEKLRGIECDKGYYYDELHQGWLIEDCIQIREAIDWKDSTYQAPSIADVIDYLKKYGPTWLMREVIEMYVKDKSIKQISTYILNNIKD